MTSVKGPAATQNCPSGTVSPEHYLKHFLLNSKK